MNDQPEPAAYPQVNVQVDQVEPVPRRIRAVLAGETVLDTTRAHYVWEVPYYPQYYIPLADVRAGLLVPEEGDAAFEESSRGTAQRHGLRLGDEWRPGAAKVLPQSPVPGLGGTARFEWGALDAWFEEDEQVFVHPRSPYVRVERNGTVLAESSSPVLVFETGLPTRYYLDRTDVDFRSLVPSDTVTACPYKGTTTGYWSARIGGRLHPDLAWCYDFPTHQLAPIAGLVAFYNERVDLWVDGRKQARP